MCWFCDQKVIRLGEKEIQFEPSLHPAQEEQDHISQGNSLMTIIPPDEEQFKRLREH